MLWTHVASCPTVPAMVPDLPLSSSVWIRIPGRAWHTQTPESSLAVFCQHLQSFTQLINYVSFILVPSLLFCVPLASSFFLRINRTVKIRAKSWSGCSLAGRLKFFSTLLGDSHEDWGHLRAFLRTDCSRKILGLFRGRKKIALGNSCFYTVKECSTTKISFQQFPVSLRWI